MRLLVRRQYIRKKILAMASTVYLHSLEESAMSYFCSLLLLKGLFGSNERAYVVIFSEIFFLYFLGPFYLQCI